MTDVWTSAGVVAALGIVALMPSADFGWWLTLGSHF
jgi:hypothetical protein